MTDQHPDPIAEGLAQGGQRIVQLAALGTAFQQWDSQRRQHQKAVRLAQDKSAKAQAEQERQAAYNQARAVWAPAHDRQWLRQADLSNVATAWCAAVPYARDGDAAAASAVRKCEKRLRDLHPHAMSHYDRQRANGLNPLEAMRHAVPFFDRDPNVREGDPVQTRQLCPGDGTRWAANPQGPSREEWETARQEHRAHRILDEFQTKLTRQGRTHIPASELHTLLDVTTNLPNHIIDKVVQARTITPSATADMSRTAAEVSADNFPNPITEAMAQTQSPGPSSTAKPAAPSTHHRPRHAP
ncbi:hypothetical protein SMC26_24100 [Actinomadura fulvescens]|uniref:Uncharacterized protein n=1 Tax=Actinomadura fulvescens TaxID=46160 RepID=A0ABP6CG16_9ACTN